MNTIKRNIKTFGRGFIEGFSSFFGLSMEQPDIRPKGFSDDREALKGDWEKVGRDMEKAIRRFEKEEYTGQKEDNGIPV